MADEKISPYPNLPVVGDPITLAIRKQFLRSSVRVATPTSVSDLTAEQPAVDNSLIKLAEDFDDFNVMELVSVARSENINTRNSKYSPIRALPYVNQKYNPQSLIALQAAQYTNIFDYNIAGYYPSEGSGDGGSYCYLLDGEVYIDLINITDEQVEVEFITFEDVFDDTIYI